MGRDQARKRLPGEDSPMHPSDPSGPLDPKRHKVSHGNPAINLNSDDGGDTVITPTVMTGYALKQLDLSTLPNELLANIFEHLAPKPVAVGIGTSLGDMESPEWSTYRARRSDLLRLRGVSRHISALTEPLLFRHILVCGPWSMCLLLCQLFNKPSLGPLIEQISSAVPLQAPEAAWKCTVAWNYLRRLYLRTLKFDPGLGQGHTLPRLYKWFEGQAPRDLNTPAAKLPFKVFSAILCLANRVEVLNLQLQQPTDSNPTRPTHFWATSVWAWFLYGNRLSVGRSGDFPLRIMPAYPSVELIQRSPCWPPPFLRKLVVEYGQVGGNFITCSTTRLADVVIAHSIAQQLNSNAMRKTLLSLFSTHDPTPVIASLSAEDHLALNHYLDSISQLEPIKALNLSAYFSRLKAAMSQPHFSSTKASSKSLAAPQGLTAAKVHDILTTLSSPRWPHRLNTTNKTMTCHLADFLLHSAFSKITTDLSNLTSLTLYINPDEQIMVVPSSSSSSEEEHPIPQPSPRWQPLAQHHTQTQTTPGTPSTDLLTTRLHELNRLATAASAPLTAIHLPLKMNPVLTTWVYPSPHRRATNPNPPPLLPLWPATVTELTLTLEGFLGPSDECREMFGDFPDGGGVDDQAVAERVGALPVRLERLRLVQWFATHAGAEVTERGKAARGCRWFWRREQRVVVAVLWGLAGFLAEMRPELGRVELLLDGPWLEEGVEEEGGGHEEKDEHGEGEKDGEGELGLGEEKDSQSGKHREVGLEQVVAEYQALGIELIIRENE